MNKIDSVLSNIPDFLNKEIVDSNIRIAISAIADEFDDFGNNIDEYYNSNDIDTTTGNKLDTRWGSLLNAPRRNGEIDTYYRTRLKKLTTDGAGGTESAIRFGIAAVLGFGPTEASNRIQVIDSWEYTGEYEVVKEFGYSVCVIDLQMQNISEGIENLIKESIKDTKASGTVIQILFNNYRIYTYDEIEEMTYDRLSMLFYNQFGDE